MIAAKSAVRFVEPEKRAEPHAENGGTTKNNFYSESTRLLEKRREVQDVNSELENKRVEYEERIKMIKEREQALTTKREELQRNTIKYNKFIQDNESKEKRALKKANDEMHATSVRGKEADEMHVKVNDLLESKRRVDEELAKISKFHSFLESFSRQRSEDFNDIRDVLQRMQVLQKTADYLFGKKKKLEEEQQKTEYDYERTKKLQLNTILSENTKIEHMQKSYESQAATSKASQYEADRSLQKLRSDIYVVGACLMAVENIFQRVCRTTSTPINAKDTDVMYQLGAIGNFMEDFRHITQHATKGQSSSSIPGVSSPTSSSASAVAKSP